MRFSAFISFITLASAISSVSAMPPRVINFATDATYPPFEYINHTGDFKGLDIEIAYALCEEMQVECRFSSISFDSLFSGLNTGKYDAIIAAISITPDREEQVNFTHAYYTPTASFVAAKNHHYKLGELNGKKIGVQRGTTFEKYLQDKYQAKIKIEAYPTIQDALSDLVAGKIDLVISDTPIILGGLANLQNQQFEIVGKPVQDANYFGVGYGIAVRKDDPVLLQALNNALLEIKANGTYNKIIIKYLGNPMSLMLNNNSQK